MVDFGLRSLIIHVQLLGLLLSGFVTLDKLFKLTVPQFQFLKNGDNYKIYSMELFC